MVLVVLQRWELPEMERHLDAIEVEPTILVTDLDLLKPRVHEVG